MKKIEKLYEGRTLTAMKGRPMEMVTVSAAERNRVWHFTVSTNVRSAWSSLVTTELQEVLSAMKAFEPKASQWKVSRKVKAPKVPKVKATQEAPKVETVMIKRGRA